jgi:uncharacterized protein (DUF58 family)
MKLLRHLYLADRFFIGMGVCSFMLFLCYSWPLLIDATLFFLSLIILLLVADIWMLFRRTTVTASRRLAGVLSLGDDNEVVIVVSNQLNTTLKIKVIDEMPYQFNRRDYSVSTPLQPRSSRSISYQVKPPVRGEYHFGNIHCFVSSKIGLIQKKETIAAERTIAVFPSVKQMYRHQLRALQHPSFLKGENKNRKMGQSYEFDQIKAYVPGDDTRNINWKTTSTRNEVMVNVYEDERSQQIYSVIDKSRVMKTPFNGNSLVDYAVNSALAFSNIVLKKQDKAGLIVFSKTVSTVLKADRGPRHLKKLLYALYRESYDYSEAGYEGLYTTIKRVIPSRSLIFLYTNFDSIHAMERNLPALKLMNKNHLLVVVFFLNDELEAFSRSETRSLLDIYQVTIARKFILEKNTIYRELQRHGIQSIRCAPQDLSAATINKYLELKASAMI